MANKDRIFIFDTTMRDGEQSPGASMSLEEKIQISRVFDELGIDIIEAGLPLFYGLKSLVDMVDRLYNKLSILKRNMIIWFLLVILKLELACLARQ